MIEATVKNVDRFIARLKKARRETELNMNTAIRIEGFRLKNQLQKEIRAGAPGGQRFAPLTYIARRLNKQIQIMGGKTQRQNPNRVPINRLAIGVRYHVFNQNPFALAVGWVGPETGFDARMAKDSFGRGISAGSVVSKSWRRLAKLQQEGFTRHISSKQRKFIIRRGQELGTVDGGNTPFFLRPSTKVFKTPPRPIINPFWAAHEKEAWHNIQNNFRTKQAGLKVQ